MTSSSSDFSSSTCICDVPLASSSPDRTRSSSPISPVIVKSRILRLPNRGPTHTYHLYVCIPEHRFDQCTVEPYHVLEVQGEDAAVDESSVTPVVPATPIRVIQYQLPLRIPISIESAMKVTELDEEDEEEEEETNENGEQAHKDDAADPMHAADVDAGVATTAGDAAAVTAANVADSSVNAASNESIIDSMPHAAPAAASSPSPSSLPSSQSPHSNPLYQSAPSNKKRKAADQHIDGDINGAEDENHLSHKAARVEPD